jgi:hypothetical protein
VFWGRDFPWWQKKSWAKIFRLLAVIGREKVVYGMFLAYFTVDYCVILQNTVIFATVQITIINRYVDQKY